MAGGYTPTRPQSFVPFTGLESPVLLLVVDTEEAFDWSAPFSSEHHSVSAIKQLHLCQSLFERFAIRPTYVIDYPIASTASAARELGSLAESGRCIIGSQLHPWVNPPFAERLNQYNSFPGNLPFALELEKLRILTECIALNLGTTPQIYKAGRYGIGPNTAGILRQLGYRVDISIHARRVYLKEGGPDFRRIPPHPFWLDDAEQLLEIPLTCDYYGLFRRWGWADKFYHDWLTTAPGLALHLPAISARLGLLNRVSISPEGYPLGEAKRLTKTLIERGLRVFTLAFHSPSLEPGNTPYVRSQSDRDALLDWLARYIEFFFDKIGGQPTTPLDLWTLARQEAAPGVEEGSGDGADTRQRQGRRELSDRSCRRENPAGASAPRTAAAATRTEARAPARIPVLMCINARYAQHAAVCLVSLLENNRDSCFDIVIATTEALGEEETKLRDSLASYRNCTLTIKLFTAPPRVNLPVTKSRYSIDTYTRLWAAEFFPQETDKILYLDADMVVVGDVRELWDTDLAGRIVAAATIPRSERCRALGIPEQYGYFNAGVLLIDLARWRSERLHDHLLAYIADNPDKIVDVDQDVLNACLYLRRLPLPYIWNAIVLFFFDYFPLGISAEELRTIQENARIIHFNSDSKPWHYLCRHPRRAEYWKYLEKTAWRNFVPEDKTAVNWLKKHVGPWLPEEMRKRLKNVIRKGQVWVRI
jgi:lipopolysaccharide biosynthesis glycosyltransferase